MRQLGLDRLVVIPAGIPPHKPMPEGSPSGDMRLSMVQAAFAPFENVIVSDIEIASPDSISYTVDTIGKIKNEYPGAELYLLVGTDMYLTLDTWYESETILKTVTPAVFSRGSDDIKKVVDYSIGIQSQYGVHTETVINNVIEISSSALREMLPLRRGAEYITEENYEYIIKNRLYGAKPDWEWLRVQAYMMLKPSRIPHVEGCEEEAVRLAEHWGVDPDEAREAAILHDITKKLTPQEHLRILENYSISVGAMAKGEEKLLHSRTGAAVAAAEFGVSDAVAVAILWHTTGRAGMSKLEKVIYLADYIEPTRDFCEVDILRAMAYENLDEAMRMGLEMSIHDMKERDILPNRITIDALNDMRI